MRPHTRVPTRLQTYTSESRNRNSDIRPIQKKSPRILKRRGYVSDLADLEEMWVNRKASCGTQSKWSSCAYWLSKPHEKRWPKWWQEIDFSDDVGPDVRSQIIVRKDVLFIEAKQNLDCVSLRDIIRRSHLTHTSGIRDPMRELNVSEQESRYANLIQGSGSAWAFSSSVSGW